MRVINQLSIAVIDQGIVSIGSFMTIILVVRFMTKQDFGYFTLAYTVLTIATGIINALVYEPFSIFAPGKTKNEFAGYWFNSAILTLLLSALLSVIILIAIVIMDAANMNITALWTFAGLSVFVFFSFFQDFLRRSFISQKVYLYALYSDIVFCIARILGIFFLHLHHCCNGVNVFLVLSFSGFLAILTGIFNPILKNKSSKEKLSHTWYKHWYYGKWILGATILYTIKSQLYPFFIAGMLSISESGALIASQQISGFLNPLLMGTQNFLKPDAVIKLHKYGSKYFFKWINKVTLIISLCAFVICLFCSFWSKQLLHVIYAGKYDDYYIITIISFISIFASTIGRQWQMGIYVLEFPKLISLFHIITASISVPLMIFAIKYWGLIGAAINNLLIIITGTLLSIILFLYAIRRRIKIESMC